MWTRTERVIRRRLLDSLANPRRLASSSETIFQALSSALPSHVDISCNPYDCELHGHGESYHPTAAPWAVVTPTCVDDVVAIVKHCAQWRIPLIPYGAGTSVEGHVCALHGGISVDMTKFDTVEFEQIDESLPDPIANVGAGVTRKRLNEELRCDLYR